MSEAEGRPFDNSTSSRIDRRLASRAHAPLRARGVYRSADVAGIADEHNT
jgi:hypothetical protein